MRTYIHVLHYMFLAIGRYNMLYVYSIYLHVMVDKYIIFKIELNSYRCVCVYGEI